MEGGGDADAVFLTFWFVKHTHSNTHTYIHTNKSQFSKQWLCPFGRQLKGRICSMAAVVKTSPARHASPGSAIFITGLAVCSGTGRGRREREISLERP